jgi:hypothetical protein
MSTPEQRSAAARLAVNVSWAYTPDRRERTQPATKASPVSLEYWEAKLREKGIPEHLLAKAAVNARRAEMQRRAMKSAATRAAKKAARAKARAGAQ